MSARKAYISSLGTTGLLVAAALAMLIVVGALVAFDRWPTQAIAEAESVPVARTPADRVRATEARRDATADRGARRATARSLIRSRGRLDLAAAQAGTVERGVHMALVRDPVVSDLPAPDAVRQPAPTTQPAPAAASSTPSAPESPKPPQIKLPQTPAEPTAAGSLAELTGSLGDTVDPFSPELGQTVRSTGGMTRQTLHALLGGSDAE
jgi:hypothetical protein